MSKARHERFKDLYIGHSVEFKLAVKHIEYLLKLIQTEEKPDPKRLSEIVAFKNFYSAITYNKKKEQPCQNL